MNFYYINGIVIGYGGISNLKQKFPNKILNFDSKFYPTTSAYASTQSNASISCGEITIKSNGEYLLSPLYEGASFNICYIPKFLF